MKRVQCILGIGIPLILIVITFFTVSCSNLSSEGKKLPTRNILSHIENSGYPEVATLISATTETFFINGKNFKIKYKINVLGNGNELFTNRELALRVLLETSLFQEVNGKFSEVNFSNAVGELSVKIVQPAPGQELSTSVRPSSVLNWNKGTGVPDIYIVNYRLNNISVKWEDSIHSDGYLYGFVCFEMKSKNSRILSGTEKRNIDKYLEPVKFDVKIRKR